jgi:hypothetical protein
MSDIQEYTNPYLSGTLQNPDCTGWVTENEIQKLSTQKWQLHNMANMETMLIKLSKSELAASLPEWRNRKWVHQAHQRSPSEPSPQNLPCFRPVLTRTKSATIQAWQI